MRITLPFKTCSYKGGEHRQKTSKGRRRKGNQKKTKQKQTNNANLEVDVPCPTIFFFFLRLCGACGLFGSLDREMEASSVDACSVIEPRSDISSSPPPPPVSGVDISPTQGTPLDQRGKCVNLHNSDDGEGCEGGDMGRYGRGHDTPFCDVLLARFPTPNKKARASPPSHFFCWRAEGVFESP